jgi:hypothetical protein
MLMNITARCRHGARLLLVGVATPALLVSMAACTAADSASLSTSTATTRARKLALGTLRLEGTPQAVDSQSAAQLLPLWQLMDELSTNGAAAPQEISAVVDQIRATMTTGQVGAIDEMTLSTSDPAAPASSGDASSPSASTGGGGMPMDAVAGGGMPPDAGGGIPGGGGMPPDPQSQNPASTNSTATSTTSGGVFQQVISLLQSKLQGGPAS